MAAPSSLESLYQQVILDHARERHGHGLPGGGTVGDGSLDVVAGAEGLSTRSHQYNPLCGDEVTLELALSDTREVTVLAWDGEGCSISQAATSVLHDLVVGQPAAEARKIVDDYRTMLRSRGESDPDEAVLGDAVAFAGVGRHANRVKCAMLGWTAFEDALTRIEGVSGSANGNPADARPADDSTNEATNEGEDR